MSDFKAEYALWIEFLNECQNLMQGNYEWKTVYHKEHHTVQEQKEIINDIFIKNATLSQIVNRHLHNKKNQ